MKILVDTNILIDYVAKRDPFTENARSVLLLCMEKQVDGCIAAHSVMNAFYILRKELSDAERKNFLLDMCSFLAVIGIDKSKIVSALRNESFSDVEDCLQAECAAAFSADYIVTRNIKDFVNSEIPAIMPDKFLEMFKQ